MRIFCATLSGAAHCCRRRRLGLVWSAMKSSVTPRGAVVACSLVLAGCLVGCDRVQPSADPSPEGTGTRCANRAAASEFCGKSIWDSDWRSIADFTRQGFRRIWFSSVAAVLPVRNCRYVNARCLCDHVVFRRNAASANIVAGRCDAKCALSCARLGGGESRCACAFSIRGKTSGRRRVVYLLPPSSVSKFRIRAASVSF